MSFFALLVNGILFPTDKGLGGAWKDIDDIASLEYIKYHNLFIKRILKHKIGKKKCLTIKKQSNKQKEQDYDN